jgi:hypothetical protein
MVVGACKAFVVAYAALGTTTGQPECDMVIKLVTDAFTVPRLSVQHAAVHAWTCLVEAKADSVVLPTMATALQYILASTTPEIRLQTRIRVAAIGAAFLAIEKYPEMCEAQAFTTRIVTNTVEIVRIDRDGERVFQAVFKGFDRLLLCFVALTQTDRQRIDELAKSWLASASTTQSLSAGYRVKAALKLLVTSMCVANGLTHTRPLRITTSTPGATAASAFAAASDATRRCHCCYCCSCCSPIHDEVWPLLCRVAAI